MGGVDDKRGWAKPVSSCSSLEASSCEIDGKEGVLISGFGHRDGRLYREERSSSRIGGITGVLGVRIGNRDDCVMGI